MSMESNILDVAKATRTNTRIALYVIWISILFGPVTIAHKKEKDQEIKTKLENLEKQNQELKNALDSISFHIRDKKIITK